MVFRSKQNRNVCSATNGDFSSIFFTIFYIESRVYWVSNLDLPLVYIHSILWLRLSNFSFHGRTISFIFFFLVFRIYIFVEKKYENFAFGDKNEREKKRLKS
jgi:hypothetical protein